MHPRNLLFPDTAEGSTPSLPKPESWIDDHADYLFNYAISRLRKPHLAEDLVQETFLAAFKAKDRFSGQSSLRTWLTSILKNKIIDHYRKQGRETPFTDLEFYNKDEEGHFNQWDHWLPEHERTRWKLEGGVLLDSAQFQQTLHECLSKLPPRVADVFTLREMEELESEQICEMLSLTPTNLRVMLHRARMALRDCLQVNWFQNPKKSG